MSLIGRPRKGFNVVSYNKQKADRVSKQRDNRNVTERLLNELAEWIGGSLEQPSDPRAWDQLLIYAPREAIERRMQVLAAKDNCR